MSIPIMKDHWCTLCGGYLREEREGIWTCDECKTEYDTKNHVERVRK